jgi:Cu/Ag efflux protein CusF
MKDITEPMTSRSRMMKKCIALSLLMALMLPAVADEHEHHQQAAPSVPDAEDYVSAEVRKIDTDSGKLTLKHGPMKKFDMPGMTMTFRAVDPSMLVPLAVGDKVRFIPDKVNGQYVVTRIEKIN